MNEYTLVDGAADSIDNYVNALDVEEENIGITLRPSFDEEGNTQSMEYELEVKESDLEIENEFRMGQYFGDLDAKNIAESHQYSAWVETFTQRFPNTDLNYRPVSLTRPEIEEAAEAVRTFINMAKVEDDEISILLDPQYDQDLETWSVDYHIRTLDSEDQSARMDWSTDFSDISTNVFKNEVYPLWINKFREDFQADLNYPDPKELEDLEDY